MTTDPIPGDLRKKAKAVMTANGFENAQDDTFVTFFVERAIAAEQERFVKLLCGVANILARRITDQATPELLKALADAVKSVNAEETP